MAAWSRCRRRRSGPRSPAPRSTSCSHWPMAASPRCGKPRSRRSERSPPEAGAMPALLVATRNEHKLRELRELLPGIELDPLPPEIELPPEEWESFAENALGKARAARAATGRPAIADDSGIEAHGLGGCPGVRSARYAGENATDEENLAKLLEEVGAQDDRRVAYVCAIALVGADEAESVFEGRCDGTLTREPR